MSDQHRFTRDMMWLRRQHPAHRASGLNVFHVHNQNRVIAFQRWVPGVGRDVVVVASLNNQSFYNQSSANITLPANSILVFARDGGDDPN